jgi:L-alanine-DL-glutamate epimerase-like enolase superfamily enzyme
VAELAAAAGLPCTPHAANLSLVLVFTLHLVAAIPNAGPYVELSIEPDEGYYPWQAGLYEPRPHVVDGSVRVPDGPGWGVEVSPGWLARAERRESRLDG